MKDDSETRLIERLLSEPIEQLKVSLNPARLQRCPEVDHAVVSAMLKLVADHPFEMPNSLRFEMLLCFLLTDGRINADYTRLVLSLIGEGSGWLYGGIVVAAHAEGTVGENWLCKNYPKLNEDLQMVSRILLSKVNPEVGHRLVQLPEPH